MKFHDLPQRMSLGNSYKIIESSLMQSRDPLVDDTLRAIEEELKLVRLQPSRQYVAQARAVSEVARSVGVDWGDFWRGVSHGITIAAASVDPDLMKSVKRLTEQYKKNGGSHEHRL